MHELAIAESVVASVLEHTGRTAGRASCVCGSAGSPVSSRTP